MPQKLRPSYKFNEEQLEQLKKIVPEAFKDGMPDFYSFYDAFSDYSEEDSLDMDDNFYGLYWPGKRKAKRNASTPPRETLAPVKDDGVDEEKTKNIYIEGDNLEVLKLLQKSYAGKIKMIYIDPPYNTGNDFIYNDDFSETSEDFGKATGQLDEQGIKQTAKINSRADGRFHSKWLNMMYPRLKLAHRLLSDDGVIFISIDDNEVAQLRKICDEIFGEENFIGIFIWRKKEGGGQAKEHFVVEHEYILVFKKSDMFIWKDKEEERNISEYKKSDDNGVFKITKLAKWGNTARREDRPTMYFHLNAPDGSEVYPVAPDGNDGRWRVGKERMNEIISSNLIYWEKKEDYWVPYEKEYFANQIKIIKQRSILYDLASTGDGSNILTSLFEKKDVFENPKPIELLDVFIKHVTQTNSIILDFFSGSSTTAHAVMQLNAEDGGNRQFIMVQLPEECNEKSEAYKAGFKNICEIGKERIRRAGKCIAESKKSAINVG